VETLRGSGGPVHYRRIGGDRERGIAVLNRSVIPSPRGVDPMIASHELTRAELHARSDGAEVIGNTRRFGNDVGEAALLGSRWDDECAPAG
jgi:hypothetical protein